jgi:taurine dioxygenase
MSYLEEPVMASVMHALTVPSAGGDTLFADLERAYETLDPRTRAAIEGKEAIHSYAASFSAAAGGAARAAGAELAKVRADAVANGLLAKHPIVRTHPETRRRALFVNRGFTTEIVGLPKEESDALLEQLFAHCERREHIVRHRWQQGDVLIWDNRRMMHHALPFPPEEVRHMLRTTVKGGENGRPFLAPLGCRL